MSRRGQKCRDCTKYKYEHRLEEKDNGRETINLYWCMDGSDRQYRSHRSRLAVSNSYNEEEAMLMAYIFHALTNGKDLSGIARHKVFPKVAGKAARMKRRVKQMKQELQKNS